MSTLKKALSIAAHLGLLGWILHTTFNTANMPNESLLIRYAAAGVFALILFKMNNDAAPNA